MVEENVDGMAKEQATHDHQEQSINRAAGRETRPTSPAAHQRHRHQDTGDCKQRRQVQVERPERKHR
jgi:hypothetical protein